MMRTSLAVLLAGSAAAQPDMLVTVEDFNGDGNWSITAEFLTTPPGPILQLWASTDFELVGDGSPISITDYNPAYDTSLDSPEITNGPVAAFYGATYQFFGTPDSSNPQYVAAFDYAGSSGDLDLVLVGENYALFDSSPFGDVEFYTSRDLRDQVILTFDVIIVPAPNTLGLAPLALIATRRRR